MNRSPMGWFRELSIDQKFLVSFGLILVLLALSLTALLFYLARINSYIDRHKRITVPAARLFLNSPMAKNLSAVSSQR